MFSIKEKFFDLKYLRENGVPNIDYHSHTHFTDATGTVLDYARVAEQKKLTGFAITDHIWKSSEWLEDLLAEIRTARKMGDIEILSGVEAKQINIYGDIDVRDTDIKKVDIVLGAVHAYPTENDYDFLKPENLSADKALEIETDAILGLIKNKDVNVIAHPYRLYTKYYNGKEIPEKYTKRIIASALDNDVALELNGKYNVPDRKFLRYILSSGARVSIGSDAHKPDELGKIPRELLESVIGGLK